MAHLSPMRTLMESTTEQHHDVVTIDTGRAYRPANMRMLIRAGSAKAVLQTGPTWTDDASSEITINNVSNLIARVESYSFPGEHRSVLAFNPWRRFYHVASRQLAHLDENGSSVNKPPEDSAACVDCGLLLPLRTIHIDHQRPQTGNSLEPICKVFRAMGLTVDGPQGRKGAEFAGKWTAGAAGLAGIATGVHPLKYTLNRIGMLYYTLAVWSKTDFTLAQHCLHHVINLRPLCMACNKPGRNRRHY